ncbi:MAG: DUF4393 domain-containing protein [Actinobacteria bacterium]|nr:DUF4393 domain-containing protein [Actinomycetota bacterium]
MTVPEPAPDREAEAQPDPSVIEALPGLARIAAGAWWRTADWTIGASVRTGSRVVTAAVRGESTNQLMQDLGTDAREAVRWLLGMPPLNAGGGREEGEGPDASGSSAEALRDRGAELLRQSADVRYREDAHPAYERILGELAPDEGRILRLLHQDGPQAAVDIRTARPLRVASELIAPGLSMIGAQAGCRYLDTVPAYLNNLERLGLVWFSREPLPDPLDYQVLEAQPDVGDAMRRAGRGRTVRRSIHLTPFGEDFCRLCLPLHTVELEALPATDFPVPEDTTANEPGEDDD